MSFIDPDSRPDVQLPDGSWMRAGRIVRWIDGDTAVLYTMTDQSPTHVDYDLLHVRLMTVNTPEKNSKDADERHRAHLATLYAVLVAPAGTLVDVITVKDDKYGGRVDGHVIVHATGLDIAQAQIDGGFGVPYDGGAR